MTWPGKPPVVRLPRSWCALCLALTEAWARARRPKCCKLANSPAATTGSGQAQIGLVARTDSLKRTHPEGECNRVSHETIYRSLFVQARGVVKKELLSHLRSKRSMRRYSRLIRPGSGQPGEFCKTNPILRRKYKDLFERGRRSKGNRCGGQGSANVLPTPIPAKP